MNIRDRLIVLVVCLCGVQGCATKEKPYGYEGRLSWPTSGRQVWAVAPAINLSGQHQVDPLLQADLLYQQVQQVDGITAIPVNRVVEVYASLHLEKVQSQQQAELVCDLLGCDGLLVPTVTIFDPYNPPKFGVAIQLFRSSKSLARPAAVDVHELVRSASPGPNDSLPQPGGFVQAVRMFDAANGSTRAALLDYADGRNDPAGPLGSREYFLSMDRYCGFAYHSLLEELIDQAAR